MPVDTELLELFVDTVTVEPYLSTGFSTLAKAYGPAVSYQAYISAKIETVVRPTGETAVSTHRVILTDRFSIDERSRITLPARFRIVNPEIVSVLEWTDQFGSHHTTILVGPRSGSNA